MLKTSHKKIKALIELSATIEDADAIINEFTEFKTMPEKIAFLLGMFDVRMFPTRGDLSDELVYNLLLNTIIKEKFS